MARPELGTKRTCPNCGARFYDLHKSPAVCPKCEVAFMPEVILPSRDAQGVAVEPRPEREVVQREEAPGVEVVSLEEVEETDDDDIAADLGDDDAAIEEEADDEAFLEEEDEDDPDVSGLIGSGVGKDDEEG